MHLRLGCVRVYGIETVKAYTVTVNFYKKQAVYAVQGMKSEIIERVIINVSY